MIGCPHKTGFHDIDHCHVDNTKKNLNLNRPKLVRARTIGQGISISLL